VIQQLLLRLDFRWFKSRSCKGCPFSI